MARRATITKTPERTAAAHRMLEQAAERIRERLGWETFETRGRDRLDFHEISAAAIREVIAMAFDAGYNAAKP